MIINYMGTLITCFESFMEAIGGLFTAEERRELFDFHREFYDYMVGVFEDKKLFKHSSLELMQVLGDNASAHFAT